MEGYNEGQYSPYPILPATIGAAYRTLLGLAAAELESKHGIRIHVPEMDPLKVANLSPASLTNEDLTDPPSGGPTRAPSGKARADAQVPPMKQPAAVTQPSMGSVPGAKSVYATKEVLSKYGLVLDCVQPFVGGIRNLNKNPSPYEPKIESYAIVCGYHPHSSGTWGLTNIWVNNPQVIAKLAVVFEGYPGFNFNAKSVLFTGSFLPFLHRWADLKLAENNETRPQVHSILKTLREILEPAMGDLVSISQGIVAAGRVTFDDLQHLFRPGEKILYTNPDTGVLGIGILCHAEQITTPRGEPRYRLTLLHNDWDGTRSGCRKELIELYQFDSSLYFQDLAAVPIAIHPDRENIIRDLTSRGRQFDRLRTAGLRDYEGLAKDEGSIGTGGSGRASGLDTWSLNERVVLDPGFFFDYETHYCPPLQPIERLNSHDAVRPFMPRSNVPRLTADDSMLHHQFQLRDNGLRGPMDLTPWTEDQCLMAMPHTYGYSLKTHRWYRLYIESIQGLSWDSEAFDRLIVRELERRIILSYLPSINNPSVTSPDDGKVVMLLSGEAGTGKRAVAEAISEKLQKPLYVLDNGEFGGSAKQAENRFSKAIEHCKRWNAVLLIEDAQRLLNAEMSQDMDHDNQENLLSAFQKFLALYNGTVIISAGPGIEVPASVSSHIDVQIGLPVLKKDGRARVWAHLLKGLNFDLSQIKRLAKKRLNGREIKKTIDRAQKLAACEGTAVSMRHLEDVSAMQGRFDIISRGNGNLTTPQTTDSDSDSSSASDFDWEDDAEESRAESTARSVLGVEDAEPLLDGAFYFEGHLVQGNVVQTMED